MQKKIAILGSTGSIGTQTLEVIEKQPESFLLEVLTAGKNADELIRQSRKFLPNHVVIADENQYSKVLDALSDLPIKVYAGTDAIEQIVQMESIDMVLTALVGFSGLRPTLAAIRAGKYIALANCLIAGYLLKNLSKFLLKPSASLLKQKRFILIIMRRVVIYRG